MSQKLAGIPPSAFFCSEHKIMGKDYVRFCFIKVRGTFLLLFRKMAVLF